MDCKLNHERHTCPILQVRENDLEQYPLGFSCDMCPWLDIPELELSGKTVKLSTSSDISKKREFMRQFWDFDHPGVLYDILERNGTLRGVYEELKTRFGGV